MSFSAKARNTKVRIQYDDYVPRPKGAKATAEEIDAIPHISVVAAIMGLESKHISHAILRSVGYVKVAPGKYYTTDEHMEGWDTERARQALKEHMAGLPQAKVKGISTHARKVDQPSFEDWSLFHYWEAICKSLEELGAVSEVEPQDVTREIRPKLAEHGVSDTDREVGATLPIIGTRTGWVARIGAKTWSGWYLTEEYFQTTPLDRARILSQWDEKGNPIALVQPIYEDKPIVQPAGTLVVVDDEVLVVHRFEWDGEPFGAPPGTKVMVEAHLPREPSAEERLGSFQFVMKLREDLLTLV